MMLLVWSIFSVTRGQALSRPLAPIRHRDALRKPLGFVPPESNTLYDRDTEVQSCSQDTPTRRSFFRALGVPCASIAVSGVWHSPLPASAKDSSAWGSSMDAWFARQMGSEAAQVYERRIYPRKKDLFEYLDASCKDILEIGIGTGPNLGLYPATVKSLTGVDPNPYMLSAAATARANVLPELVKGSAERLPFPDECFDAVVSTLVLCSVDSPAQVLSEVSRVLRPGGRYLFMEHVRSQESGPLGVAQDVLNPLQVLTAAGCHLNRNTGDTILAAAAASSSSPSSSSPPGSSSGALTPDRRLFERVEPFERFNAAGPKGEQFLISPHVSGVAWKGR